MRYTTFGIVIIILVEKTRALVLIYRAIIVKQLKNLSIYKLAIKIMVILIFWAKNEAKRL